MIYSNIIILFNETGWLNFYGESSTFSMHFGIILRFECKSETSRVSKKIEESAVIRKQQLVFDRYVVVRLLNILLCIETLSKSNDVRGPLKISIL